MSPIPFYQPLDPDQKERSMMAVEEMVEMFTKQVEFEFQFEEDTVNVLTTMDRYLLSLKVDLEMGHESIIAYTRLVLPFRSELYKHYARYMYNNPAARATLHIGNDEKNSLSHMLALIGGMPTNVPEVDPIKAKALPPVDPDMAAKSVDTTVDTGLSNMESSFGLSMNNVPSVDNISDFDLQNFINGKF